MEDILGEEGRDLSRKKSFLRADRNGSKKEDHRVAGLAARHRDLRGIHLNAGGRR